MREEPKYNLIAVFRCLLLNNAQKRQENPPLIPTISRNNSLMKKRRFLQLTLILFTDQRMAHWEKTVLIPHYLCTRDLADFFMNDKESCLLFSSSFLQKDSISQLFFPRCRRSGDGDPESSGMASFLLVGVQPLLSQLTGVVVNWGSLEDMGTLVAVLRKPNKLNSIFCPYLSR